MFDYIVIGAGSAGCVLANRLTADGRTKVMLIEAGRSSRNPWISIPAGAAQLYADARVNWCYYTEEEQALNGRRVYCPRGKVLGGSSSINGLVYMRGAPQDYDHWRQLGNTGWSWSDVLPYFRRGERQERGADAFHGSEGELHVSDLANPHPASRAFVAAGRAIGLDFNEDFNGERQDGIGYVQYTVRHGVRESAATAFLDPVRGRPNLRVVTGAHVRRVIIEHGRATGVEYERAGVRTTARAGETIVSAGAIGSPQILLLSGIGPGAELSALGVPVVHDATEVGRTLHDHIYAPYLSRVDPAFSINRLILNAASARTSWRLLPQVLEYAWRRSGLLTSAAAQVAAFARSGAHVDAPDLQIQFRPFSMIITAGGRFVAERYPAVTASCSHIRPHSRGSLTLRSSDPFDRPKIRFNYLDAAEDQRAMVEGMRIIRRIFAASPLREHVTEEATPGPSVQSDEDILAHLRQHAQAMYHPVGSCRMGPDRTAVVDPRLRVRGVTGLRVVDASIMPSIVSGNTNAPTLMIAEKAADMIRADAVEALAA